jgi:hypothetical protein
MRSNSSRNLSISAFGLILIASASLIAQTPSRARAQETYSKDQNISPAYEGWEQNPDGSFNFLFGYINRNWLEEPDVPVGVDNSFSPGSEDRGQPTHFLPRRNRFVFKVRVPEDWGDKELVWTLTSAGKTEKAYASLRLDYIVDNMIVASETGALNAGFSTPASRANTPPVVMIEGDSVRRATVGQRITLIATVDDDGLPRVNRSTQEPDTSSAPPTLSARQLRPPSRITVAKVNGLHLSWFVYRGQGEVTFDPFQVKVWEDSRAGSNSPWSPLWRAPPVPEDMRWEVGVTFDRPGTYVLRGRADDGGLYGDTQVRFIVAPIS